MNKYKVTGSDGHKQGFESDYIVIDSDKVLFFKQGPPSKDSIPGEIIFSPDELVAIFRDPICVLLEAE